MLSSGPPMGTASGTEPASGIRYEVANVVVSVGPYPSTTTRPGHAERTRRTAAAGTTSPPVHRQGPHVAVAHRDTLRRTGRTRGVLDVDQVVGVNAHHRWVGRLVRRYRVDHDQVSTVDICGSRFPGTVGDQHRGAGFGHYQ